MTPRGPTLVKARRRRRNPAAEIAADLLTGSGELRQRTFDFLVAKLPAGPARKAKGKA